jgi:hypothetical protein
MAAPWTGGARIRILGKLHGQDTVNVLHFATNTVINDNTARDALILQLMVAVLACVTDQLLDGVTSDWSLQGVEGTPIHPVLGDPQFDGTGAGSEGNLGATSASFIATLVTIRTGLGGRSHRGRFFLPPPGELNTANSIFDAGTVAQIQAFLACLAGKFIGAGATEPWRLGVLSRKKINDVVQPFDNAFTEATSLTVTNLAAIMGSRKVGRGS